VLSSMVNASSEMRNLRRLLTPLATECAGFFPSRASRLTLIGEQRRNSAASCGVTEGSDSDGLIIRTSRGDRKAGVLVATIMRSGSIPTAQMSIEFSGINLSKW
jgi:hypothetical protein